MDETHVEVKSVRNYLYCPVDKQGKTVGFILTARRNISAAKRFFDKAMATSGRIRQGLDGQEGVNKVRSTRSQLSRGADHRTPS